jgi:hypothetical protein
LQLQGERAVEGGLEEACEVVELLSEVLIVSLTQTGTADKRAVS